MIENLDHNIGRVIEKLREKGMLNNTYVIFFSDHGDMLGSHGQFRKTVPYEEAVRVPALINHVDIAPTTLGLCDIDVPQWMEGTDYSFYRLLDKENTNEPDSAFIQSVVATGHPNSIDKPWRGLVTRNGWKYVCFENMPWLLFNA